MSVLRRLLMLPDPLPAPHLPRNEHRARYSLNDDHFRIDHRGELVDNGPLNNIEQAGQESFPARHASQMLEPKLELKRLKFLFPDVPMLPFPSPNRLVILDGAKSAEITFPDGALIVRFATSGNFLLTLQGKAVWPVAGDASINTPDQTPTTPTGVLNPTLEWYYCKNIRTVSVISNVAGTIVSAGFVLQSSMNEICGDYTL